MEHSDSGMAFVKSVIKRYPRIYRALIYIFAAQPHNTTAYAFVHRLPEDAKILNIGSGPRKLREGVTNIDVLPFEGVDIVANAETLPFPDSSIDAAVCDNVFEHMREPDRAVAEIVRVLKPGGRLYVAVPFVIPFHSSPDDYYRWSPGGLRELLKDFKEEELKIQYGPSAAFTMVLSEWLALLFSFNSKTLYTIVLFIATVITAPLKLLDYLLVHYKGATIMPLSNYFIGVKK